MKKGSARIALYGVKDVLVVSLREFKTLPELIEVLQGMDVDVSLSSLHRYLKSELQEEYECYLKVTGRGLLRNRGSARGHAGVRRGVSPVNVGGSADEVVGSPGDLHDAIKKIKL
ncbi:hypothetical protein [Pseudomonas sp. D(2018)]|uniref:hypothetical protein n=1 Tax=Pseudomonas sp. D(2018) TaxID=2502238 RepID=UPI0010F72E98|nr:hypothetical protein [Pseudomonas sp. D(2018)]